MIKENEQNHMVRVESPQEHKTLDRDGYAIHYFVSGKPEGNLIVFLHAAFADHRCFEGQIDFFTPDYRVVTLDLLGHGLSHAGKSPDRIDKTADHVAEIIRAEGYDNAHVIGVSLGSLMAQYVAFRYPEMVRTLAIVGGYNIHAGNREVRRAQFREGIKWIVKAVFSMQSFRRHVAHVSVINPRARGHYYEMAKGFNRRSFRVLSKMGKILSERPHPDYAFPVLILRGEYESGLGIRMADRLRKIIQGSEMDVIPNAGHVANMDNMADFNQRLMTFLRQV